MGPSPMVSMGTVLWETQGLFQWPLCCRVNAWLLFYSWQETWLLLLKGQAGVDGSHVELRAAGLAQEDLRFGVTQSLSPSSA